MGVSSLAPNGLHRPLSLKINVTWDPDVTNRIVGPELITRCEDPEALQ